MSSRVECFCCHRYVAEVSLCDDCVDHEDECRTLPSERWPAFSAVTHAMLREREVGK